VSEQAAGEDIHLLLLFYTKKYLMKSKHSQGFIYYQKKLPEVRK